MKHSNAKRKELAGTSRGAVGKTAVVGAKDRATKKVNAKVVAGHRQADAMHDFVADNAEPVAVVYTDDAAAYEGIPNDHETVKHSVSRIRRRDGAYQWDRELLVDAEARS